jgi:hypothetical protein
VNYALCAKVSSVSSVVSPRLGTASPSASSGAGFALSNWGSGAGSEPRATGMSEVILQTYFRHPQICGRCAAVAKDAFKKMAIFQIDRVQSLRCAFSVMTVGFGRIFLPGQPYTRQNLSGFAVDCKFCPTRPGSAVDCN